MDITLQKQDRRRAGPKRAAVSEPGRVVARRSLRQSARRFVYVNPALIRMLKAESASELLGTSVFDRIDPGHNAMVIERIRKQLESTIRPPLGRAVCPAGRAIDRRRSHGLALHLRRRAGHASDRPRHQRPQADAGRSPRAPGPAGPRDAGAHDGQDGLRAGPRDQSAAVRHRQLCRRLPRGPGHGPGRRRRSGIGSSKSPIRPIGPAKSSARSANSSARNAPAGRRSI